MLYMYITLSDLLSMRKSMRNEVLDNMYINEIPKEMLFITDLEVYYTAQESMYLQIDHGIKLELVN